MENTKKRRIELHIDPAVKTVRIIAEKESLGELIDCFVQGYFRRFLTRSKR